MSAPYSSKEWLFDDPETIYATDLYSGVDDDAAGIEVFTDDVDLTEYTNAEVDVKFAGSNATDDLYLSIYKRNDSNWSGNEQRWKSRITIENDGTETEYHYTIPMVYGSGHYRFGFVRSGSTTTFELLVSVIKSRTWNRLRTI